MAGSLSISRQGSLASIVGEGSATDVTLERLGAIRPFAGRLSANLKFGASGESMSGIVANLAGGGDLRFSKLDIANADPGALDRGLARALKESDPLATPRLAAIFNDELNRGPFQAENVAGPVTLVGGALRVNPFKAGSGDAVWQGGLTVDFRTLSIEARGTLQATSSPKGWTGSPPFIGLGWRGPLANAAREVDPGTLVNGLAAVVLQRELEKIEAFEADINERARQSQRAAADRAREQAKGEADEAARRAAEDAARRAAEDAARQRAAEDAGRRSEEGARQRAADEAVRRRVAEEAARRAEEAARQTRLRQQQEAERARALQGAPPPLDIRPPLQVQPPG
jgi:hypothetical protein